MVEGSELPFQTESNLHRYSHEISLTEEMSNKVQATSPYKIHYEVTQSIYQKTNKNCIKQVGNQQTWKRACRSKSLSVLFPPNYISQSNRPTCYPYRFSPAETWIYFFQQYAGHSPYIYPFVVRADHLDKLYPVTLRRK